jgi:ATP-dependent RNA helicase RhlE
MNTHPTTFHGLGIAPGILHVLHTLKFSVPTPIQHKAIPPAIEGKDIIGIAQTGTGKTLAFGIPMVQRLAQRKGRGLVLVPTRELALQVNETMHKLTAAFKMRTAVLIGGESMHKQIMALRAEPRVIIATPGRLNDHIQQRLVKLHDIHTVVLDEADRMLDMGFLPQIRHVLEQIPRERQTMLFSATMPGSIVDIAARYMQLPVRTEIAPQGTAAELVEQELFVVKKEMKAALLGELLKQYSGSVLLFIRTRVAARKVTRMLVKNGHSAAEIHSDRTLAQRTHALKGFKSGAIRILVATDIAARGIDVTAIELVINFDLPDDPENYVHRIGRTGRAGLMGRAITFATPEQWPDVRDIEKIIRTPIPRGAHPKIPVEQFVAAPAPPPRASRRPGSHAGRRFGQRPPRRFGRRRD